MYVLSLHTCTYVWVKYDLIHKRKYIPSNTRGIENKNELTLASRPEHECMYEPSCHTYEYMRHKSTHE